MTLISKNHDYNKYDDLNRFISYYHQIELVRILKPKKILEIGIGNKTVSDYLRRNKYDVVTCDVDKKLKPDVVADVRKLPFKDNSFDLILICEVLEHIPYQDFSKALRELHRVTKKNVIMSVPYSQVYFGCSVIFPFIQKIFNKQFLDFFVGLPSFTKIKFDGSHYWEIGRRGYPIKRIRKDIRKHFRIVKEKRALPHPVHYFFILEKLSSF